MKLNRTACSLALLGILCAGLAMPGRGRATECDAYTNDATAEDSYEPNNTSATATQLTDHVLLGAGGDPSCGVMFASTSPDDWYKIVVPASNTGIQIALNFKNSLGDIDLWLYDIDGTTSIRSADNTDTANFEYIDYQTVLPAGTYYIKVTASQPGNNRYKLEANIVSSVPYTVTSNSGTVTNGTITPASQSVISGGSTSFTVTPATGYTASVSDTCGTSGSIGSLNGTTYTVNPVTKDCAVTAVFSNSPTTYTVTSNSGSVTNGTITPASQSVASGGSTSFTVTPATGYTASVSDTCGTSGSIGSLNGTTYTVNPVTKDCAVTAVFSNSPTTYTVSTNSGTVTNGTITPASQSVASGGSTSFTVTPATGYTASASDNCGASGQKIGSLVGVTYTINPVTKNCAVTATFTLNTYTVSSNAATVTHGTVSPAAQNNVAHGSSTSFTVTPATGYTASASDNCGASGQKIGSLVGTTYTITPVTKNCSAYFGFTSPTDARNSLPAIYKQLLMKAQPQQ
jgi:hypothetical protein